MNSDELCLRKTWEQVSISNPRTTTGSAAETDSWLEVQIKSTTFKYKPHVLKKKHEN